MKNTVDNLSKSKVILMCGPAGAGKSTLAKKFESTGMTIEKREKDYRKNGSTISYRAGCGCGMTLLYW